MVLPEATLRRRLRRSYLPIVFSSWLTLVLCLTSCAGPSVPLTQFSLDRHFVSLPSARLEGMPSLDGGAAFVVATSDGTYVLTPAMVWSDRRDLDGPWSLEAFLARYTALQLDTFTVPHRRLLEAGPVVSHPSPTEGESGLIGDVIAFEVSNVSSDVAVLSLAPGDYPEEGEVHFVIGCADATPPCVATLHPVVISRVWDGGFAALPHDVASMRAFSGAPLVNAAGDVTGMFVRRARGQVPEALFCPVSGLRDAVTP